MIMKTFSASSCLIVGGLILVGLYVTLLLVWRAHGLWLVDAAGVADYSDFFPMWVSGHEALRGAAATAYDFDTMKHLQSLWFVTVPHTLEFNYPPTFLFLLAPLSLISYPTAMLVWLAATLALYLATIYAIIPRPAAIVVALASPLAFWEAITFQNGFLSAALIGGALLLLERRPVLAGVLIGLLAYKPHLGLLFPVVLIASCRWRAFAGAAVTTVVMAIAAVIAFGTEAWVGFFAALEDSQHVFLDNARNGWAVMQSVYGLSHALGADGLTAWLLHGAVGGAVALGVALLWAAPGVRYPLKAAALAIGSFALSPYFITSIAPMNTARAA
jgi:arabinofuranan 3-O-arabinosyltransferase